jgi:large subunit ribosomal protein L28
MAEICEVTGKGKQFGHNVSHSKRRTKRTWKPNLQTKTVVIDGRKRRMKVSAQGIRTLRKQGLL